MDVSAAAAAATTAALTDGLLERVFQALEPPDRQVHPLAWRVRSRMRGTS